MCTTFSTELKFYFYFPTGKDTTCLSLPYTDKYQLLPLMDWLGSHVRFGALIL